MLHEAYGDDASSQMMICEWFRCFKNGRASLDDDELSDRLSTSRTKPLLDQVKNIHGNRCRRGWNIHGFMPHNFNGRFRNALGLTKFVPGLLTDDQKLQRFSMCENLLWWWNVGLSNNQMTVLTLEECCFFFITDALCIMNSFLKVGQLLKIFIR
jgi:hypothetical protein